MKKLMVFGGSGRVGSLVIPFLTDEYEVHVFDLSAPQTNGVVYHEGDVTDRAAVRAATEGMDAVIYMAMVPLSVFRDVSLCYDIYLKGLHFVLEAARDFNVRRVVSCSTGSVYHGVWPPHDDVSRAAGIVVDDAAPDARNIYGMTKSLGEQVCAWFCEHFDMTVFVQRLYQPMSFDRWDEGHRDHPSDRRTLISTLDRDVAQAFKLALASPVRGCQVMSICGDWRKRVVDCRRARDLLGWEPTRWPAA